MSIISPVFAQARSRRAGFAYVRALLGPDGRRSCWQLAELAGHASPRRLQALLTEYVWGHAVLAERVRALLVDALADSDVVLAVDETAGLKAGDQTVGVAPQYAGITGQVETARRVVFAAHVTARAHALMDFLLYLPKAWIGDAGRRWPDPGRPERRVRRSSGPGERSCGSSGFASSTGVSLSTSILVRFS